VHLNIGHGSTGWTMGCGSGKIVADFVAGRRPDIDLTGLPTAA
jgi:D-amino-acid dehydrogenase